MKACFVLTDMQYSGRRLIEWNCQVNVGHCDDGGGGEVTAKDDGEEENGHDGDGG